MINRDDSMISGAEFRARRLALNLQQPLIQERLGVSRSILDKWQAGTVQVSRRARQLLEAVEGDVDEAIYGMVEAGGGELPAPPPDRWPWGELTWFVAVARARAELAGRGLDATIGPPVCSRCNWERSS